MRFDFNGGGDKKSVSCFFILPLVIRLALSYLFSGVSANVSDSVISFALSAVLNALSWILPFAIYGFFLRIDYSGKAKVCLKETVYVFFSAYFIASLLSVVYSCVLLSFGVDIPKFDLSDYGVVQTVIFVVSSAILIPIAEEFAFRKIVLSSLLPFGKIPAIIITAVLFALCHNPSSYVYSFVFGIALAFVAKKYGWKFSVFIHSANNTISCIYMILEQYLNKTSYGIALSIRVYLISVLGVYCTAMIVKTRCNGGKKS